MPTQPRPSYDLETPEPALAEWSSKIRNLQNQVDEDDNREANRMQDEIVQSRLERTRRRSLNQFDPGNGLTGFASRGSAAPAGTSTSKGAPISLASFIGGKATGPRLNKVVAQPDAHDPTKFDTHPYANATSPLAQVARGKGGPASGDATSGRGVRMPGMAAVASSSQVSSSQGRFGISTAAPATPVKFPVRKMSNPPVMEQSSTSDTRPAISPKPTSFTSSTLTTTSTVLPPNRTKSTPAASQFSSRVPAASSPITSPVKSAQPQTSSSPFIPASGMTPAFSRVMPPKDLSPSLTRLRGRGFVGERVKASADLTVESTAKDTAAQPPTPRRNVLDRWQPAATSSEPSLPLPPAPRSPIKEWTPAVRNTTTTGTSATPKVAENPVISKSTSLPPTTSPIASSSQPPLWQLPSAKKRSESPSPAQPIPIKTGPKSIITTAQKAPTPTSSGITVYSQTTPRQAGQWGASTSLPSQTTKTSSDSGLVSAQLSTKPVVSPPARGFTDFGPRKSPLVSSKPFATSQVLSPKPAAVLLSKPTETNDFELDIPTSSKPLNHPTKERARKPRKGGSTGSKPASSTSVPPQTSTDRVSHKELPPPPSTKSPPPKATNEVKLSTRNIVSAPASKTAVLLVPADSTKGSLVGRLAGAWGDQAPIGVKAGATIPSSTTPSSSKPTNTSSSLPSNAVRRALPGMASSPRPLFPSSSAEVSRGDLNAKVRPRAGSRSQDAARPSAMDLAEAMTYARPSSPPKFKSALDEVGASFAYPEDEPHIEVEVIPSSASSSSDAAPEDLPAVELVSTTSPSPLAPAPAWRNSASVNPGLAQGEKRRSVFDRFPPALPPLVEVNTPPPSMSKATGEVVQKRLLRELSDVSETIAEEPASVAQVSTLPNIDIEAILASSSAPPPSFNANATPISVDVLCISGRSASPISSHQHIFYDSELRAIVYRSKDSRSGLASTTLWTWKGKDAKLGEAEEWKIRDLETRFSTKAIRCMQGSEPYDLTALLGGVMVIRQGPRAHWSIDNTTMHCVRSTGPAVYIDQVDLDVKNLCSAFSYIVSVLGTIYVWHGRGALAAERSHALAYSALLAGDSLNVAQFDEGHEDPMFWMCLGEDEWANASYWSERGSVEGLQGTIRRVWRMRAGGSDKLPVDLVHHLDVESYVHDAVYVLDGIFELFVIVGKQARSKRREIRLAIDFAQGLSSHVAPDRPFKSPVHVLILPSQLPLELRNAHTRFLDQAILNGGDIPDHINLLPLSEALEHLDTPRWPPKQLEDDNFLPLGQAPI